MKNLPGRRVGVPLLTLGLLVAATASARADAIADFYKGNTVHVLIGVNVGGGYDLHARLVARHIGKHIPGNPAVVPQNIVGSGGIKMSNQLYNVVPKDGSYFGMMPNTLVALQAVKAKGIRYDTNKLHWMGTINTDALTMAVWHTSGIKNMDDARNKEIVIAASSRGAITYTFPRMMNEYLGTKFKIVLGYHGTSQMSLAMERGEAQGHVNSWTSWQAKKPRWLKEGKIRIIAQSRPRSKDLPNVPLVEEMARNDDDRQVIELIVSGVALGKPLAITPATPAARVKALRTAFDATMKDPAFIREATAAKVDVAPVRGVALQNLVRKVLATPPHLVDKARKIIGK
ncbi:MAG: tripartite tricarboxylate transporter substrate-binding protein [Proteobacteria bacterium]|nr:tripartite tricarboxylate transporter substrate-binding protein [Pseudomonadota bacterium]